MMTDESDITAAWCRDGFFVSPALCSDEECDRWLDRLHAIPPGRAGSRRLFDDPWCRDWAVTLRDRLGCVVAEFVNRVAIGCQYFDKSEGRNWLVPYHQDRSIPVAPSVPVERWPGGSRKEGLPFVHAPEAVLNQMAAVRLHLDPSRLDNGPLRVIPASHRLGLLTQDQIASIVASSAEHVIPVERGGVLVMRPGLLHASSKAVASDPRRVVQMLFAPPTPPEGLDWAWSL